IAGPGPDTEPGLTMPDGLIHGQPLGRRLFPCNNDIDIVPAAQTVIRDGEKAIRIGRQIDTDDFRLLVDDVIDEARVLMAESIVVLAPNMARQQVVQGSDGSPPWNMVADFQPFGVLIEHRVDDVDERLVAREETMSAGQEIPFQPALTLVLA